jgi:hypothetical protein
VAAEEVQAARAMTRRAMTWPAMTWPHGRVKKTWRRGGNHTRASTLGGYMRWSVAVSAVVGLLALAGNAAAQTAPGPSESAKAMAGVWEMSNADRDRTCSITFKLDASGAGYVLEPDKACAQVFAPIREMASWSFGRHDMLLLFDGKGRPLLELLEVEAGMFEGLRPGEERYFLQNAAVAAASRDRTADQMFGQWSFTRSAGKPICEITLADVAADADNFAITVKPGCDPFVARFGPVAWRMERGQLVMKSARGQTWRFEESDPTTWQRIPATADPVQLVKQ